MLKVIALGIAAGIVLAGSAMAQPLAPPALETGQQPVLVKHDKHKDGPGRKLGHYKHRHHNDDDDYRSRRWSSQRSGTYRSYDSPRYYDPPGYGSSRPPAYFAPRPYHGWPY